MKAAEVDCPSCGARPGEPCILHTGGRKVRAPWGWCVERIQKAGLTKKEHSK